MEFEFSAKIINRAIGIVLLLFACYEYVAKEKEPSNFLMMAIIINLLY